MPKRFLIVWYHDECSILISSATIASINAIRLSPYIKTSACDEKCKMAAVTKRVSNILVANLNTERILNEKASCSGILETVNRICVGGAGAAFSVEEFCYDSSW